jgi:hypothetical protein
MAERSVTISERVKNCGGYWTFTFSVLAELFTLLNWNITESNKCQNVMFYVRAALCH